MDFGKHFVDLKMESKNVPITLEEIFDCCNGNETPRRLLIEGQPGMGKTTLSTKLAFDWANDAEYMQRFDFVFFLRFRYLEQESITESIKSLASSTEFADQEFITRLMSGGDYNVLVILDGYDEIQKSKVKENANKILYRKEFNDATVVVTCRSGLFSTDKKLLCKMFQGMSLKKKFYDKRANIIGLGEKEMNKLLMNYVGQSSANMLMEKFGNEFLSEMFKCPLLVRLMGYHFSCNENAEFLKSRTSLFKCLINDFVQRKIGEDDDVPESNIDAFKFDSNAGGSYRKTFSQFGSVCLELIQLGEYELEDCEETRILHKFGCVNKFEFEDQFKKECHFEAIHFSFLEFFAAYHLWYEMKSTVDNVLDKEKLLNVNAIYINSEGTSLILPFLAGLLEITACTLFQQLIPHSVIYSASFNGIWNVTMECMETEEIIESLSYFLPPDLDLTDDSVMLNNIGQRLINFGVQAGKFKVLLLEVSNNICNGYIPQGSIPTVIVDFTENSFTEELYLKFSCGLKTLIFSKLQYRFYGEFMNSNDNQKIMTMWLMSFQDNDCTHRNIYIDEDSTCDLMLASMEGGMLLHSGIQYLDCELNNNNCKWKELLLLLIDRNKVQHLNLDITNEECLNESMEIVERAVQSKNLKSLDMHGLENSSVQEDSNEFKRAIDLMFLDGKKWENLCLEDVNTTCSTPVFRNFSVTDLTLITLQSDENMANALLNSSVQYLDCNPQLIHQISNVSMDFSEQIFQTLSEIIISVYPFDSDKDLWESLSHFQNLDKIGIECESKSSVNFSRMIYSLQEMAITVLEFRFDDESIQAAGEISKEIESSLLSNLREGISPVKIIDIMFWDETENVKDVLSPFLHCLEKKIIREVGIMCDSSDDMVCESLIWIDNEKFAIKFYIAGSEESDLQQWKTNFNTRLDMSYKVRIKLRKE